MRKQTFRKEVGVEKMWVPGPGKYAHGRKGDIGRESRNLQQWKTPPRSIAWHNRSVDGADVLYSSLMDHLSISRSVAKGEKRYATTMHKCTARSPSEIDSRRASEKLNYKIFEVVAPVSTLPDLGPGRYPHERPGDIGREKRNLQAWKSPIRNPNWMIVNTDAPAGDALFRCSPFNIASKNKCGGSLSQCWPLPEDDEGRPMTTQFSFSAQSPVPLSPVARTRARRPPATA